MLGAEKRLSAIDRQLLGNIHEFAAAVVALARIAFGIFVGQHRACRLQHRFGDKILRRDQLDARGLPLHFLAEHFGDLRIGFGQRPGHAGGFGRLFCHGGHHFIGRTARCKSGWQLAEPAWRATGRLTSSSRRT